MTKPKGSVNHATLEKLRSRYLEQWGVQWPHDDEYLKILWRRVREDNPPNREGYNEKRWHDCVMYAMRECHEFTMRIPG